MIPPAHIAAATAYGIANARAVALACERVGCEYATGLALVEKESMGRNIYGHDRGGVFSTYRDIVTICGKEWPANSDIPVTAINFAIFYNRVGDIDWNRDTISNGVGPCQITYARALPGGRTGGYFRQMLEAELKPWRALDNCVFGIGLMVQNWRNTGSWVTAGALYNGGPSGPGRATPMAYGRDYARKRDAWLERLEEAA